MKAVLLDVPESLLAERRAKGADVFDEMWEGVLHMVPPPSAENQRLSGALFLVLAPLAKDRSLVPFMETGLFRPGVDDDYKVPDHLYTPEGLISRRGVDGPAALVVELRSPGDETDEKLPWYGRVGVGEVLVLNPDDRRVEVFVGRQGRMVPVAPDPGGSVPLASLGVNLRVDAGRLVVTWEGGEAEL